MLARFLFDSTYPLDKHFFLIPKFCLRLIGFYPEKPWNVLAVFNYVLLFYGCYAEARYGFYYLSIDPVMAMDALAPVACSLLSLYKISCLWWYRTDYVFLIDRIRKLLDQQDSKEKRHIKRGIFTLATRMTMTVMFLGLCTSSAYALRPLGLNTFRYFAGKEYLFEMPFKMMFPSPLHKMPLYPLSYLATTWHGHLTVISFVGTDGVFMGFCLYFTTLLKTLQEDIKTTLREISMTAEMTKQQSGKSCEKLCSIIERHNEIAELTKRFSSIVVALTLGHFVSSSLIIGTSVIDLLLFSSYGITVYVVYTCAVTADLFLFCYGGTALIESSQEVGNIAYCTHWYSRDVKIQKMVMLLVMRAQRPLVIEVPFFAPSLPVFASILRFAGSLIALVTSLL